MRKQKGWIWLIGILGCFLTLGVFISLWNGSPDTRAAIEKNSDVQCKTFLIAGIDDAAENTDMMMLCSQNFVTGELRILQIPRDTLYRTEGKTGKINRVFRSNSSKLAKKEAADFFTKSISEALGVSIDGYLIFDGKTLVDLVDLIGGVHVNVPIPITYTDQKTGQKHTIPVGESLLSGEAALAFVRHRESYVEGDLGRLDAQMRFLCGLYEEVPKLKKWDQLVGVYQKILPNLLTNLREKDIIEFMMGYLQSGRSVTVSFLRLPGEASYTNGAWYYVLHRAATEKMLAECFGARGAFDSEGRFTDPHMETVRSIYSYPSTAYRILTVDDIKRERILQKKT